MYKRRCLTAEKPLMEQEMSTENLLSEDRQEGNTGCSGGSLLPKG